MAVRLRKLPPSIFQRFFRTETAGGSVLLLFGIAALALANSPLAAPYLGIWRTSLTVGIADYSLSLTLHLETASVGVAKLGILAGSLAAGVAGAIVLRIASGFRNE